MNSTSTGAARPTPPEGAPKTRGFGALSLALLLAVGGLLVVPHEATAATVWHNEVVGLSDTVGQFRFAPADNERVGLAYRFASGGAHKAWGFAIRSAGDSGTWSIKSADITAGASVTAVYCVPHWVSGTIWLAGCQIAESTNCCNRMYRSTDDGVTWSNQNGLSPNINTNFAAPLPDTFVNFGSKIGLLAFGTSISDNSEAFSYSSDGGVTWTTQISISDNAGSPSGTPSSNAVAGGGGRIQYNAATHTLTAAWVPGSRIVGVESTDDGSFWTVPYTTTANCNADAYCGPPGNNGYCEACASVSGGSVVLVKARFPASGTVQNELGYASNGLYAYQDGTTGGLSDVQAGATSVETPVGSCTTKGTAGSGRVAFEGVGATWIAAQQCTTPNALNVYEKVGINTAWSLSTTFPSITTNDVAVGMTPTKTYVAYTDSSNGGQVHVAWATTPTTPTVIPQLGAAASTAAFPSGYTLTGFDVDYMQRSVIARLQHAGDQVETIDSFDPITLATRGATPLANQCLGLNDGVMATWQDPPGISYDGYIDCTAVPHTSGNRLSIRDGGLNSPPDHTNTLCTTSTGGGDFCAIDLTSQATDQNSCANNGQLSGVAQTIGQVQAIPISWRGGVDKSGSFNVVNIGFAYSTKTTGAVGVWMVTQQNQIGGSSNTDQSCYDERPFTGNSAGPADICSWHNSLDGQDYLTAVDSTAQTLTWRVDLEEEAQHELIGSNIVNYIPHLVQVSQLASMTGVGCNTFSNSTVLGSLAGVINRYVTVGPGLGNTLWNTSITDGHGGFGKYVTSSRNGAWGVYVSGTGTTWQVFNAINGTKRGSPQDMPTGTFRDIYISGNGQDVYIATSTGISRYHVTSLTTVTEQPDNCDVRTHVCVPTQSNTKPVTPPATDTGGGTGSGTGLDITAADGFCIVCAMVNTDNSLLINKNTAYIIGFIFVALSVGATIAIARKRGASVGGPVSGALLGIGVGGAYILFLFPLFIIILASLLAAAAVVVGSKRGTGA